MANREVREQEVTGLSRTVEIGHAGDEHASQNRRSRGGGGLDATLGDGPSMLKGSKKEEVRIVIEGDILGLLNGRALENAELDNRRRVNGTTIGGGLRTRTTCSGTLGLLQDVKAVNQVSAALGVALDDSRLGLHVGRGHFGRNELV